MEDYRLDFIPVVNVFLVIEANSSTASANVCCSGFTLQSKENVQNRSSLFSPSVFALPQKPL
jgi:hypothetical protein